MALLSWLIAGHKGRSSHGTYSSEQPCQARANYTTGPLIVLSPQQAVSVYRTAAEELTLS